MVIYIKHYFSLFLCFGGVLVMVQGGSKKQELQRASQYVKLAQQYEGESKHEKAIIFYKNALGLAVKWKEYAGIAMLNRDVARCYAAIDHHVGAIYYLNDALETMITHRSAVPEATPQVIGDVAQTLGVHYYHIGCHFVARKVLNHTLMHLKQHKLEEAKITQTQTLLDEIDQHIAETMSRNPYQKQVKKFNSAEAILIFDYPKEVYWSPIIAKMGGVLGLLTWMIWIMVNQQEKIKENPQLYVIGLCVAGIFAFLLLTSVIRAIIKAPIPVICTKDHIAIPFYTKKDSLTWLLGTIWFPAPSKRKTYYVLHYDDIEKASIIALDDMSNGLFETTDHTIQALQLIKTGIYGAEEYLVRAPDCDPDDFVLFCLLVMAWKKEEKRLEADYRKAHPIQETTEQPFEPWYKPK